MIPKQPPTPPTHTHPTPNLGGCEEDLSNERRGLLHRGQTHRRTDVQTHGHRDSMTESAQWADSVKTLFGMLEQLYKKIKCMNILFIKTITFVRQIVLVLLSFP